MRFYGITGESGKRTVWVAGLVLLLLQALGMSNVIYVDANSAPGGSGRSWGTAYRFLQDALTDVNALHEDVEIRIARGVYRPDRETTHPEGSGDRKASFVLGHGVTLKGGYAGMGALDPNQRDFVMYETVLSGDLAGNDRLCDDPCDLLKEPARSDNSYHVLWMVQYSGIYSERVTALDGLTICAGNAGGSEQDDRDFAGGGVYSFGMNLAMVDCIFHQNSALRFGGALYVRDSELSLLRCTFRLNLVSIVDLAGGMGGGVAYEVMDGFYTIPEGMNPINKLHVLNCNFEDNLAKWGGGLSVETGPPTRTMLTGCSFHKNSASFSGGAIYLRGYVEGMVQDCRINKNSANNNGGGVAIHYHNGDLTLLNCTVAGNYASFFGGGIYASHTGRGCGSSRERPDGSDMRLEGGTSDGCIPSLTIDACIISGNRAYNGGGVHDSLGFSTARNSTFYSNRATHYGGGIRSGDMTLVNNILWGNSVMGDRQASSQVFYYGNCQGSLLGCPVRNWNCIEGFYDGFWDGVGNIGVDPCFAEHGFWLDPTDPDASADPNNPQVQWADGDYHLKSQNGRWDPQDGQWVIDDVTSPCIDAGDPQMPVGCEPYPHGRRVNLGAYGRTAEASKSDSDVLPCPDLMPGDINGDCRVDLKDYELLLPHWSGSFTPGIRITTTYQIRSEPDNVTYSRTRSTEKRTLSVSGRFSLTVDADAGMARLSEMDAVLSEAVNFISNPDQNPISTDRLDILFRVNDMTGRKVTEQEVVLKSTYSSGGRSSSLMLSFMPGSVRLTGWSNIGDGGGLGLEATADVTGIALHND